MSLLRIRAGLFPLEGHYEAPGFLSPYIRSGVDERFDPYLTQEIPIWGG
jgi:hypothetical protein